jgi:hypothetical protein
MKASTARNPLKAITAGAITKSLSISTKFLFDSESKLPTQQQAHQAFAYRKNRAAD